MANHKALNRDADNVKDTVTSYIDSLVTQIEELTDRVEDLERDL